MDKLLTKKDLAERWQLDERTIDKYRADKIITPCKGIPAIRFNAEYIAELEGVKLEKFSPLERRRLERQLGEVTRERDYYKSVIAEMDMLTSKVRVQELKEANA